MPKISGTFIICTPSCSSLNSGEFTLRLPWSGSRTSGSLVINYRPICLLGFKSIHCSMDGGSSPQFTVCRLYDLQVPGLLYNKPSITGGSLSAPLITQHTIRIPLQNIFIIFLAVSRINISELDNNVCFSPQVTQLC